nr:hypothetical protein Q903MT_gene2888 [Picea sitchensis]
MAVCSFDYAVVLVKDPICRSVPTCVKFTGILWCCISGDHAMMSYSILCSVRHEPSLPIPSMVPLKLGARYVSATG